jgi:hypothetical protein
MPTGEGTADGSTAVTADGEAGITGVPAGVVAGVVETNDPDGTLAASPEQEAMTRTAAAAIAIRRLRTRIIWSP